MTEQYFLLRTFGNFEKVFAMIGIILYCCAGCFAIARSFIDKVTCWDFSVFFVCVASLVVVGSIY